MFNNIIYWHKCVKTMLSLLSVWPRNEVNFLSSIVVHKQPGFHGRCYFLCHKCNNISCQMFHMPLARLTSLLWSIHLQTSGCCKIAGRMDGRYIRWMDERVNVTCLIEMGANIAMRKCALMAQDETAVQYKPPCIPTSSGYRT